MKFEIEKVMKKGWKLTIIENIGSMLYIIKSKNKTCTVFIDDELYWKIYPYKGSVTGCGYKEIKKLKKLIQESFDQQTTELEKFMEDMTE